MKKWIFCLLILLFCSIANTSNTGKNEGEVVYVDTSLYFFKIMDNEGNETKFFAPEPVLKNAEKGTRVQVKYSRTTDKNLKALEIKTVKEKKKSKRHRKNLYEGSDSKTTGTQENPSCLSLYEREKIHFPSFGKRGAGEI